MHTCAPCTFNLSSSIRTEYEGFYAGVRRDCDLGGGGEFCETPTNMWVSHRVIAGLSRIDADKSSVRAVGDPVTLVVMGTASTSLVAACMRPSWKMIS
jgi:hypothetical protein